MHFHLELLLKKNQDIPIAGKVASKSHAWRIKRCARDEMNAKHRYPEVKGHVEISHGKHGIFIGGDPPGLRSLAKLLNFFAEVDQEKIPYMPDGERDHTHLRPGGQLSENSLETEICRLDAKGTGEFPRNYKPAQQGNVPNASTRR